MKIKTFSFMVIFLCLAIQVFAFGSREKKQPEKKIVQITGVVRLVGNEPFTELVITGNVISAAGESNTALTWYISNNERAQLHNLQQRTVIIEGEETVTELTLANGRSAGTRRDLKNIKIISVESYEQ